MHVLMEHFGRGQRRGQAARVEGPLVQRGEGGCWVHTVEGQLGNQLWGACPLLCDTRRVQDNTM